MGAEHGELRELEPVLNKFLDLMADASWTRGKIRDAPWWYNERASVSQFAGAIWQANGWAFEEYAVDSEYGGAAPDALRGYARRGRCDLLFELSDGFRAVVEAKQVWPRTCEQAIGEALKAKAVAAEQINRYQALECERLVLVFVVPRLAKAAVESAPERIDATLQGLVRDLAQVSTCRAWAFPKRTRDLVSSSLHPESLYPGVVALISRVAPRSS